MFSGRESNRRCRGRRSGDELMRDEGRATMVTWVLTQEPDDRIARAIEIVEYRLGNEEADDVSWMCADVPSIEPIE
jgi:hypothetical protein